MTNFFYYKHPTTGKIYSDQRMIGFEANPYKSSDGIECELLKDYVPPIKESNAVNIAIINKNREVFEADPEFVKKTNPRYVKFQDGHRERYDSSKHC